MADLLAEEESYALSLSKLATDYLNIVPQELLGPTSALLTLHVQELLPALQAASPQPGAISQVFVLHAGSMAQPYRDYIENFPAALAALSSRSDAPPDLYDLLGMVVRRVDHYALALEALGAEASRGEEVMNELVQELAPVAARADSTYRVLEIQRSISGWEENLLAEVGRELLGNGQCTLDNQQLDYFLFNDMLVFASPPQPPQTVWMYHSHFHVDSSATIDTNVISDTELRLQGSHGACHMRFADEEEASSVERAVLHRISTLRQAQTSSGGASAGNSRQLDEDAGDAAGVDEVGDLLKPLVHEGTLWKRSSTGTRFQERWFQLRGNTLYWYEDKEHTRAPLGFLSVVGKELVDAERTMELPNVISLVPGNRQEKQYWLRHDSRQHMMQWVDALDSTGASLVQPKLLELYLGRHPAQLHLTFSVKAPQGSVPPGTEIVLVVLGRRIGSNGKAEHVLDTTTNYSTPDKALTCWVSLTLAQVHFPTKLVLLAVPSPSGKAAVARLDWKSGSVRKLGSFHLSLAELLHRKAIDATFKRKRAKHAPSVPVNISIFGEEWRDNSRLLMRFSGKNLAAKQKLRLKKTSDPFLSFLCMRDDQTWEEVTRTDFIKGNLNPEWPQRVDLHVHTCSKGDEQRPLKVQCLSFKKDKSHSLVGEAKTSVLDLKEGKRTLQLQHMEKGFKNSGTLTVESIQVTNRFSLFEYIKGGLELQLNVAVDFCASNGHFDNTTSLHHPNGDKSSYRSVLKIVGDLFASLGDSPITAWGTGAGHAPVFELGGVAGEPDVANVQELLTGYHNARSNVQYGTAPPTILPVLEKTLEKAAGSRFVQDSQKFQVLVVLTNSDPTDRQEFFKRLAVESEHLPVFVAIVGLGRGNFKLATTASRVRKQDSKRRIASFTSMSQCRGDQRKLATNMFEWLEDAVTSFAKMKGVEPTHFFGKEHVKPSNPFRTAPSVKKVVVNKGESSTADAQSSKKPASRGESSTADAQSSKKPASRKFRAGKKPQMASNSHSGALGSSGGDEVIQMASNSRVEDIPMASGASTRQVGAGAADSRLVQGEQISMASGMLNIPVDARLTQDTYYEKFAPQQQPPAPQQDQYAGYDYGQSQAQGTIYPPSSGGHQQQYQPQPLQGAIYPPQQQYQQPQQYAAQPQQYAAQPQQYAAQPQYGSPHYGGALPQQQYAQPAYGQQPQYGQPGYAPSAQYGQQPTYGAPPQPQYSQYGAPAPQSNFNPQYNRY